MLTAYENRPTLGHNKQSYCFRMMRSLLVVLINAVAIDGNEESAVATADNVDVDDDDVDGNGDDDDDYDACSCKLFSVYSFP